MDARPILEDLAKALQESGLEAILIGNAAAALHGAPVTTVDFDFFFRKTPRNISKLKTLAGVLHAVIMRPFYPSSGLFRVVRDEDGLQVDFMDTIDGFRSFAELRSRSNPVEFAGATLLVADLGAIIKSKRAAGRPRDKAVLDILNKLANEEARQEKRPARRPEGRE